MSDNVLDVRDLSVVYGSTHALHSVSLQVARGEIVALVGRSGAGKSTLVNAIMHMLPSSASVSGDICVDGSSISDVDAGLWRNRRVSIVPQDPFSWFNPLTKVYKQMDEVASSSRRWRGAAARVASEPRLQAVGLDDSPRVARSYPHELSGGMRQRVALATALIHSPPLVLADEPTSSLDAASRDQILSLLHQCRDDGRGVLLISHDRVVVDHLADRVLYIEHGSLVSEPEVVSVSSSLRVVDVDAPTVLKCESVSMAFKSRTVLRDVAVEVKAGETVAMVGASGIGKSTLCRIAAGFVAPASGSVSISGVRIADMSLLERAAAVQLVFQDTRGSLDERLSAYDLIAAGVRAMKIPAAEVEPRVRWACEVACFPYELRDRKPKQLSGGQVQRAALARAVVVQPSVLILDEPFSALDAQTCSEVASNLVKMQKELKTAILTVMHDVDVVPGFATRTVAITA